MGKRIGILGGTFDPPHYGHLIIANEVLHQYSLNEVRFMPNHEPPHKVRKSGTTDEDRKKMLELSISDNPAFALETIEFERSGLSYTVDTIHLLREENPADEFYFIIGGDMVEYLPHWNRIDELMEMVTFIGVGRPGYRTESPYPILHAEVPQIDISSTAARERAAAGKPIKYLLPDAVVSYIKEHKLYGTRKGD